MCVHTILCRTLWCCHLSWLHVGVYRMIFMSTTQFGYSPLVIAAHYGRRGVVMELLDNGADVNAQSNVSPINTVIEYKVSSGIYWSCRMIGVYIITQT